MPTPLDTRRGTLISNPNFLSATGAPPAAVEVPGLKIKNDGNNVSVDREARLLAENALRFNVATELMRSQIRAVRSAIQEGKAG